MGHRLVLSYNSYTWTALLIGNNTLTVSFLGLQAPTEFAEKKFKAVAFDEDWKRSDLPHSLLPRPFPDRTQTRALALILTPTRLTLILSRLHWERSPSRVVWCTQSSRIRRVCCARCSTSSARFRVPTSTSSTCSASLASHEFLSP